MLDSISQKTNIMDINYTSGRKLNRELINRLQPANIYQNIVIYLLRVQPVVVRLTWLVPAWKHVCSITKYVRMPDLLMDLELHVQKETIAK